MATPVNWSNVSMLTPGMKNLGNQFNKRWPERSGDTDGAIGDWRHQQGHSGHNPDDTLYDNAEWDSDSDSTSEVRAIDVDKDLNESGTNMQMVIDHLRSLPNLDSVIRYMIYNGKIYKATNNFNPETYTGSNSHKEHAHFSGAYSQSSDQNNTFDFKFEEVGDMALTIADKDWFRALFERTAQPNNGGVTSKIGRDALDQGIPNGVTGTKTPTWMAITNIGQQTVSISKALEAIAEKVDLSPEELEDIRTTLAVPTAQENAEAVLEALGGTGVPELAEVLRDALSPEDLAALKAAL